MMPHSNDVDLNYACARLPARCLLPAQTWRPVPAGMMSHWSPDDLRPMLPILRQYDFAALLAICDTPPSVRKWMSLASEIARGAAACVHVHGLGRVSDGE